MIINVAWKQLIGIKELVAYTNKIQSESFNIEHDRSCKMTFKIFYLL